ncbi:hypothetical protein GCM10009677_19590 [Sphaerisporangium rubeum]|uniref:Amino acid adenylation domain-containing protein n=1 Tax=Sphaerisporangium rubeum TaxID=321317 RepID=A0A7X0IK79_9ACTN|nr:non-ribosomal peptide synthetase [Sphaerisporangium rubeum]MBB6476729.1 amino acid adenylation domain-containing protein [Sphaerisporangium rubeum]
MTTRGTAVAPDLMARFAEAVAAFPARTAVIAPDGELTFAELDARVSRTAGSLAARGAGPGSLVGVRLPRGAGLVVALLAVWRAGAAYLPLDPAQPDARLQTLIDDAAPRFVVTPGMDTTGMDTTGMDTTGMDTTGGAGPGDTAYVIYTSGSTGRPKGVQVSRGAVAHLVDSLEEAGFYGEGHRVVAWNAAVSFDASVQQWARVCRGDTLVLIENSMRGEPELLARHLSRSGVTDLDVTPSHWSVIGEPITSAYRGTPLRLFVGGEAIPEPMWRDLSAAAARGVLEPINVYGPTECAVDSTGTWIGAGSPHIGAPLPRVRAYVLDDALRPVPQDEEGELYIAGPGLADGYLRGPALTARRFVADVVAGDGSRMYATGDRARRRADGTLEYAGRADRQVKIRGHRVEPGEIETVLARHPAVARAVVVPHDGQAGPVLVAYHTAADGNPATGAELRDHVAGHLPAAMVPAFYVAMDTLPLNQSGKVDHAALPVPDLAPGLSAADALSSPAERVVAEAWAAVLGVEPASGSDDFFALGGHSLTALYVIAHLKRRIGVVLPTRTVYRLPRLGDLARHIEGLSATHMEEIACQPRS